MRGSRGEGEVSEKCTLLLLRNDEKCRQPLNKHRSILYLEKDGKIHTYNGVLIANLPSAYCLVCYCQFAGVTSLDIYLVVRPFPFHLEDGILCSCDRPVATAASYNFWKMLQEIKFLCTYYFYGFFFKYMGISANYIFISNRCSSPFW